MSLEILTKEELYEQLYPILGPEAQRINDIRSKHFFDKFEKYHDKMKDHYRNCAQEFKDVFGYQSSSVIVSYPIFDVALLEKITEWYTDRKKMKFNRRGMLYTDFFLQSFGLVENLFSERDLQILRAGGYGGSYHERNSASPRTYMDERERYFSQLGKSFYLDWYGVEKNEVIVKQRSGEWIYNDLAITAGYSGVRYDGYQTSCCAPFLEQRRQYLQSFIDVNAKIHRGKGQIHIAAEHNDLNSIKELCSNPNIKVNSEACVSDRESNVKIIKTALHIAVENNALETVKYLCSHPNINIPVAYHF